MSKVQTVITSMSALLAAVAATASVASAYVSWRSLNAYPEQLRLAEGLDACVGFQRAAMEPQKAQMENFMYTAGMVGAPEAVTSHMFTASGMAASPSLDDAWLDQYTSEVAHVANECSRWLGSTNEAFNASERID